MSLAVVVLAAGKGTRMESDLPKVLHPLCGKPLVAWVLETARALQPERTVLVVGHGAAAVESAVNERFDGVEFVTQRDMKGTGDAVRQAEPLLAGFAGDVVVLCGDAPLLQTRTLVDLVEKRRGTGAAAALLVGELEQPGSYGRVVTGHGGTVTAIVEAKDASPEVAALKTVNSGTYCFASTELWPRLGRITDANKSGEYYLTDVVGLLTQDGLKVAAVPVTEREMTGINTRAELHELERQLEEGKGAE